MAKVKVCVFALVLLAGCALFRSAARTALDVAREACDAFLAEQPPEDRPLGMSIDECADHLLAAQRGKVAAARQQP